ncbi:MAG: hypothetical protein A2Y79_13375 [Deltaproteobacteria bacterium RBG_13_43_22]|nr:MAG: hypothetical protein A2Y79_13375 [Deltaproteobacteria bacterium RBG_13_43_22]
MSRIFLSHVERDLPIMLQIAQGLEAAGYSTWYFERDVLVGTSYLIQITQAIEDCEGLVLIASPNAFSSDQVTKEVVGGFERGKPFFPVLINITPPELKERQPEWRHALGGTAMITVGPEGIPAAVTRIIEGLKAKGIMPGEAQSSPGSSVLSTSMASAPKHVVERVLAVRSSLEGERKQVTVLFADAKGFATSEKLDPEEVHDLISPCLEFMTEEIRRYEGTMAQSLGYGLMALFGAPIAHEDAPHRALYAALAIQRRLKDFADKLKARGIELALRIGINTGLVIVGRISDDLTMEYTAIGDTVTLASAMENTAVPGAIQVAENTYRQTEGYFDFEDLGETKVQDKEQPVRTFKVIGPRPVRTRIEASLGKGLTPFVGRNKELDHLMDCYEQAKDGQGQVVSVMGEAGMGKSRLVREFTRSLPFTECSFLEGKCLHYGDIIPYLPILDILKSCFDIHDEEDEALIKQKIGQRINEVGGHLIPIQAPIHEVLSLPVEDGEYLKLEAGKRREKVFEAIRLLLMAESQKKPLILVVDDLHWMDKTSEEFLTSFIGGLAGAKILLILLFRPDYTPAWAGKTYLSQIRVDQLPKKISSSLVQSILIEGEAAPDLIDLIVNKAASNPLFMEELTHNLLENGSIEKKDHTYRLSCKPADIQVPDTIQGIIAARLDRLEENLKRIIQTASVIGREFAFRILQAVTSLREDLKSSLLTLQDLEFINEKSIFPELEYIFKHALTQEVAYTSLLLKRRRETHEQVGQAIEGIYANRLEEFYEMLAYHYALSNNSQKAYQFLKLSGDKAVKNYANWEAIRFYKEALRVLDSQPENEEMKREKMELMLLMYLPLMFSGYPEGSFEILQRLEKLAQDLGDEKALIRIHRTLSIYHIVKGNLSLGLDYAEKCFNGAEKTGETEIMLQSADQLCFAYYSSSDSWKVADIAQRALRPFEEHQLKKDLSTSGQNVYSLLCSYYGGALTNLGSFEEAKPWLEKGIRNARELKDKFAIGWGELFYSILSFFEGDGDNTIAHARESLQFMEEAGFTLAIGVAWCFLGGGHYLRGEYDKARDHAEKGLKIQKESVGEGSVVICNSMLALILLDKGELGPARDFVEEVLKYIRDKNLRGREALAYIILGSIAGKADPSHIDEAKRYIQKGISKSEELKSRPTAVMGYLFLGELLVDAGQREEALENLKKAEALYREMGVNPSFYWPTRVAQALARLESTEGKD